MELEFFCQPGTDLEWFQYWREFCRKWLVDLGLKEENLRLRDHEPKSWPSTPRPPPTSSSCSLRLGRAVGRGLPHQLRPDRPPEHLRQGSDLLRSGERRALHPLCGGASLGADRVTLAFLVDAYDEEVVDAEKNDVRTVLRLHPALAPFKCAVLPLSKKLGEKGREIQAELSKYFMVDYDDAAPSASATAGRTRSALLLHHRGLPDRGRRQDPRGQCSHHPGTATPWSRCVFPSAS